MNNDNTSSTIDNLRKAGWTRKTDLKAATTQLLPKTANKKRQQNDPLYNKLKDYHDNMLVTVPNTTTEKLSQEIEQVVLNQAEMDDRNRKFKWNKEEESRLNDLNMACKLLQPRDRWT